MKKAGLLLMSLALSTALWAESPEKKGLDVINRSTAEAHIGFLADDDLEGREAGFRGGRIAGDYIVANLKSLGIDPVGDSYYHPFEAYHMERQKRGARWQVQPDSIAAIKQTGVFQKRTGDHDCLGTGWQSKLCVGRIDLCSWCGDSMAARRTEADRFRRGF